jgi:GNAT superfamily N-acetyltransferase
MTNIERTDSENVEFVELVRLLDEELKIRDGDEHSFYAQYNKLDLIKHVVLAYENEEAIGCGAFKKYGRDTVEIKRMFVNPAKRGKGIAVEILRELETWAGEENFAYAILETGYNQPEAIRLYQKSGYEIIPNYGQYEGVDNSLCMKKRLPNRSPMR